MRCEQVSMDYEQEQDCICLDSIEQAEQHLTKQKSNDVAQKEGVQRVYSPCAGL